MLIELVESVRSKESLDMIYISSGGVTSKLRIKVFPAGEDNFRAYCYFRKSKKVFRIDNILALVPVYVKESAVI